MESLMKKDLVEVINRQRSGTLAEYTAEPNVITEDIDCLLYTSPSPRDS